MEELLVNFTSPEGSVSQHVIYCKKHSLRQQSPVTPNDKTLFTAGWPPYVSRDEIRELFSRIGEVEAVYVQEQPGPVPEEPFPLTGRSLYGYIVFKSKEDAACSLSLCSGVPIVCAVDRVGLSKMCEQYQFTYPTDETLRSMAEEGVLAYDKWKLEEDERKKRLSQPDKEGWITVTKKMPKSPQKEKKRKKKMQVLHFYSFQQRENQRAKIAELRKKFTEDQKKVAAMKSQRKFKPF